MREDKSYLFKNRNDVLTTAEFTHNMYLTHQGPEIYKLTVEDEISKFNEECRILREWLVLGEVSLEV